MKDLKSQRLRAMKRRSRYFLKSIINHVYQRAVNGFLVFYNVSDYLVFFTMMCIIAPKYGVQVLMCSLMPDHFHLSSCAERRNNLSNCVKEITRLFAHEQNLICHREGQLFSHPFGSVPKPGDKKGRANLIYVGNNGPERRLALRAEDYRWSFLAYAKSDHPFSEPIVIRRASPDLKRAIKEVESTHNDGKHLKYRQLQRLFKPLVRKEKEQLTDFIISLYNIIDYDNAAILFDSFDDMLNAMHSNTGSEYDINEVFIGKSDAHYAKMMSLVLKKYNFKDIHDVLRLSLEEKNDVFQFLMANTDALPEQIAAFLRIPVKSFN